MNINDIRLLRADEIECRVAVINEKGVSLLLYKDARVDQRILDEIFTPFGWKRTHQSIDGNLYCTVEVFDDEKKMWIAKQDVGVSGYAEKEKSKASDSFKRACFNWGIGRELYSAPFIWIPANKISIEKSGGKLIVHDRFTVQYISYSEQREITALRIVNGDGKTVFEKNAPGLAVSNGIKSSASAERKSQKQETKGGLTAAKKKALEKEILRTGITMDKILERYHLADENQLTDVLYERAMEGLRKTKDIQAA